jgi:ParB family chromosome partitioning protein
MNPKKPSLGRGLEALLGQASAPRPAPPSAVGTVDAADARPDTMDVAREQLVRLPLDVLQRGRYQPRVDMRPETLEELAQSIKSQGVVQPIVVRPIEMPGAAPAPAGAPGQRYEIIAGERRWRAAQIAGLPDIPAVVRRVPDEGAIAMALIENIQRENLNPMEEARALDRLIREFEITHQEAADAVGRSRAAVSNLLRLLDLAPEVAERVDRRELEMGHARALLGLTQRRQQIEVAQLVSKKSLSVRETEALVRRLVNKDGLEGGDTGGGGGGGGSGRGKDPNVAALETRLAETLGAKVAIEHSGKSGKGRLVVAYNSLDELDGILEHIR